MPALALALALVSTAAPKADRSMELSPPKTLPVLCGPSTADPGALAQWLERQAGATVVLPVALETTGPGFVGKGQLVTRSAASMPIAVDDSKLGVSLADRFRQAFPTQARGELWLAGSWAAARFWVSRVVGPVAAGGPLYAKVEVPFATPALAALVEQLGTAADREEPGRKLVAAGLEAIPVLIAALGDGRPYETRDIANRMNLPVNARVEPLMSTTTVGQRCEELLHRIITPAVEGKAIKVFSTQVLRVDDWRAFWAARKGKTLAQLHDELSPLVKAYWDAHGTTQKVP